MYSSDTTKYYIHLHLQAEGVVERSDVVGAIFGQTEGLLGEDLDLRDLQRTGRVGRIDVQTVSKKGETLGEVHIYSSLDKAETALLAASLETIDRVGPCNARVTVKGIEDIRVSKRRQIVERAKEILLESFDDGEIDTNEIIDTVREHSRIEKLVEIGEERLPAGPNTLESDAIIIVEGRADVITLLRYGIKNSVAVEGTNVPPVIISLSKERTSTAFLDGDRGGDLILSELFQVADIDYVALSPRGKSVEEMTRKEITKALRNKIPVEYLLDASGGLDTKNLLARSGESHKKSLFRPEGAQDFVTEEEPLLKEGEMTLELHMSQVSGNSIARFLAEGYAIAGETDADLAEEFLEEIKDPIKGLVIDRTVNQKLLDRMVQKGVDYIAAPHFYGIVKKPVSIRLVKMH